MSATGFGFEIALTQMKKGAQVARLKWIERKSPHGKVKIGLTQHGAICTWYLNYTSDRGVVSTDDILANDWVVVEPESADEYKAT
jgi:hypothetical protein